MSDASHNTEADHAHAAAADAGHHGVGHIVPIKYLVANALALLVFTWLTVAVINIDLGEANIYIALGIATIKALLVMLFFMHLYWDRPFNSFVLLTSVLAVMLFILFAFTDSYAYQPEIVEHRAAVENNPNDPNYTLQPIRATLDESQAGYEQFLKANPQKAGAAADQGDDGH